MEVPNTTDQGHWLTRMWFYVCGYLTCLTRGKLDRFDYLIAQAQIENYGDLHGRAFMQSNNPWCMHKGGTTKRAEGVTSTFDEGELVVYKTSLFGGFAFSKAWADRLGWDDAHDPNVSTENLQKYMEGTMRDVGTHLWSWHGYNVATDKKESYMNAWNLQYEQSTPNAAKVLSGHLFTPWGKILGWILVPTIFIAIVYVAKNWKKWKSYF